MTPGDPVCEYYTTVTTWHGGMPRTRPGRYCLKPTVKDSQPPRCPEHEGLWTGEDILEHADDPTWGSANAKDQP